MQHGLARQVPEAHVLERDAASMVGSALAFSTSSTLGAVSTSSRRRMIEERPCCMSVLLDEQLDGGEEAV